MCVCVCACVCVCVRARARVCVHVRVCVCRVFTYTHILQSASSDAAAVDDEEAKEILDEARRVANDLQADLERWQVR